MRAILPFLMLIACPVWAQNMPQRKAMKEQMEFIKVPEGRVVLKVTTDGSKRANDEVVVPAFWLSQTEVTVEQYRFCVKAGVCKAPQNYSEKSLKEKRELSLSDCNYGKKGRDHHPVNCISAHDAETYAEFVNARLPKPEEMQLVTANLTASCESAVIAGQKAPGCDAGASWAVCSKGKDVNGFCDLLGNVSEWLAQEPGLTPSAPVKPKPRPRFTHGGHYESSLKELGTERQLRNVFSPTIGFRVARDLK